MNLRLAAALLAPPLLTGACTLPPPQTLPAHRATNDSSTPLDAPSGAGTRGSHTVVFEVTSADGTVDMVNWSTLEDSGVDNAVKSGYRKTARLDSRTGVVGVNASDSSRVKCRLTVDGTIVDEGESDNVVNCSYIVK